MRDLPIKSVNELRADAIDMTGRQFGSWLVLCLAFRRYYPRALPDVYWWCRCLGCGRMYAVRGAALRRPGNGRNGGTKRCLPCRNLAHAERNRAKSRRVGDGRTVAQIAQSTGLKLDTVYHRLIRGWKPYELDMPLLGKGERRTSS